MVALYVGGQKVEWADAEKVLAEAERIELRNAAGKVLGVVPQPLIRDDDPDWVKARDASEKDGKIVDHVESVFMDAVPYSPMK